MKFENNFARFSKKVTPTDDQTLLATEVASSGLNLILPAATSLMHFEEEKLSEMTSHSYLV